LTLDEALTAVDEARAYLRVCHDRLEEAKKRIEVRPEAGEGPARTPENTGTLL
jgi:exodeoxyribonuclease VII small subunit